MVATHLDINHVVVLLITCNSYILEILIFRDFSGIFLNFYEFILDLIGF